MSTQIKKVKNNHYISRFLTEPWEYGQRSLLAYDFEKEKYREVKSKSFLTSREIYSDKLEKYFSDYIETPVGLFRSEVLAGKAHFDLKDWSKYRGLQLLIALQSIRFSSRNNAEAQTKLEEMCDKGESFADNLISAHMQQNQLCLVRVTEFGRLFFPETGMFPLAVHDTGCESLYSWAFGVPLHPEFFIASLSKTVNEQSLQDLRKVPNLFMGRSLGTSKHAKRVVVPKSLVEANGKEKIKEVMIFWRKLADEHITLINKLREQVQAMWSLTGFNLEREPGNVGGNLKVPKV